MLEMGSLGWGQDGVGMRLFFPRMSSMNLLMCLPHFLGRFNIQTSARCENTLQPTQAQPLAGEPNRRVHLAVWKQSGPSPGPVALWVGSSEKPLFDLELWRDQTSCFNGRQRSSEKSYLLSGKPFSFLLLGQVQVEKESAFKAWSQMFLLAVRRTKRVKVSQLGWGSSNCPDLVYRWACQLRLQS